jgi:hypothetical protein
VTLANTVGETYTYSGKNTTVDEHQFRLGTAGGHLELAAATI